MSSYIKFNLTSSVAVFVFCTLALLISPLCQAETSDEEKTQEDEKIHKESNILEQLKDGEQRSSEPVKPALTEEASEQGFYVENWGAATFRLSLSQGLEMSWEDSEFLLHVGGRIYIDFAHYVEDKNDLGDNGIGIRTVLVEMSGQFTRNWPYRLSWGGFTEGGKVDTSGVKLDDAFVRYLGFENMVLTMGQHTEPFSLEEQTSSLNTTFMERGLPNALAPGTTVGISLATGGENWFATGGFFSEQLTDFKDQGNLGYGVTGYFSFSPWRLADDTVHLGSSLSYRSLAGENEVFFRNRPESGLTTVRYVNTGIITGAQQVGRFGFDFVSITGPWSIQAEYLHSLVKRSDGFAELNFAGWYTFVSYFLTGESRNYRENGLIGPVVPNNPAGAWEIALRYSELDLNDADIQGGEEQNITIGANWYVNQQIRLMLNYTYVFTDENANDNGSVLGNDSPHIFQMRFQGRF